MSMSIVMKSSIVFNDPNCPHHHHHPSSVDEQQLELDNQAQVDAASQERRRQCLRVLIALIVIISFVTLVTLVVVHLIMSMYHAKEFKDDKNYDLDIRVNNGTERLRVFSSPQNRPILSRRQASRYHLLKWYSHGLLNLIPVDVFKHRPGTHLSNHYLSYGGVSSSSSCFKTCSFGNHECKAVMFTPKWNNSCFLYGSGNRVIFDKSVVDTTSYSSLLKDKVLFSVPTKTFSDGFSIHIESVVNQDVEQEISNTVNETYGIRQSTKSNQLILLRPERINCKLTFNDSKNEYVEITGDGVYNKKESMIRVDFFNKKQNNQRHLLFSEKLSTKKLNELMLKCELVSQLDEPNQKKTNESELVEQREILIDTNRIGSALLQNSDPMYQLTDDSEYSIHRSMVKNITLNTNSLSISKMALINHFNQTSILATYSSQGEIKLWDIFESGECLSTYTTEPLPSSEEIKLFQALDSRSLLLLRSDGLVELRRIETGERSEFRVTWPIVSATIDLKRKSLVIGLEGGIVEIWSIDQMKLEQTFTAESQYDITSVVVLDDNRIACAQSAQQKVHVLSKQSGELLNQVPEIGIWFDYIDQNAGKLIIGSSYGQLGIWNVDSEAKISSSQLSSIDEERIDSYLITESGKLVGGFENGRIRIWDIRNGRILRTLKGHSGGIGSFVAFKDKLISHSYDGTIKLWSETGECLRTIASNSGIIYSLALLDKTLFSGQSDGVINSWKLESGEYLRTYRGHNLNVESMIAFKSGLLVSTADDRTIKVWNISTGVCLRTIQNDKQHDWKFMSLTKLDENKFISGSTEGTIRIIDVNTGDVVHVLRANNDSSPLINKIRAVVFRDGELITASDDKVIRVWSLRKLTTRFSFTTPNKTSSMVLTAKKELITGSEFGLIQVWKLNTGEMIKEMNSVIDSVSLSGHLKEINSLLLSQNGKQVISASRDRSVRVWDLESGACVRDYSEAHHGSVNAIVLNTRNGLLVSAGDRTIKLWTELDL